MGSKDEESLINIRSKDEESMMTVGSKDEGSVMHMDKKDVSVRTLVRKDEEPLRP